MDVASRPGFERSNELLHKTVSIDLEVDPTSGRIFRFAAVRACEQDAVIYRGGQLADALRKLEAFARPADYLIGHNFIRFDLAYLETTDLEPEVLRKPAIDTLWLNPLAFPRNPYHHLVKHYQDGRLQGGHVNDPELDARLVLTLLSNQIDALSQLDAKDPTLLQAFHWLTTTSPRESGFDAVFSAVRGQPRPEGNDAKDAICVVLKDQACTQQIDNVVSHSAYGGWPLAYALSWISVAGGGSVMPPWVRYQFPEASNLIRRLRDLSCLDPECAWCRFHNDPRALLQRWFGFADFRPEPSGEDGRSLQETIVAAAMAGDSVLGILPTGTGKSVCYQLPALSSYEKTGALTVVISPLVALMADQVDGLRRQGIASCIAINGLLSLPERHAALDQVRLGDTAILLISPEQLRNPSVRSILKQREVGYWVLDEAHCISKWGHDFRPDYRYVARFIKEYSADGSPSPIVCLTATAKPGVIEDIRNHFQTRIGVDLTLIDGGAVRHNLAFEVIQTDRNKKLGDIVSVIEDALPRDGFSGAIVYCATRSATERVAGFLKSRGFAAEHYHAGLKPEAKREVQEHFRDGNLRVIVATNAFGMGIDKPDIRLVVHGDIPGSLENYIQEAGRAGRDQHAARCVLLFSSDDIERQFSLNARSHLAKGDISSILKSLRRLDRRYRRNGEVIATPGEIVKEELDHEFVRDSATDDTRVKTAVAWLEESALLLREENRVRVFPSSLKIRTLAEAERILRSADLTEAHRGRLVCLVQRLISADPDEGISTDDLSGASGFSGSGLRRALNDLEVLGIASNDTAITVFLNLAVEDSSGKRFSEACNLEIDLIEKMQELTPNLDVGESQLNLKLASQELRDAGYSGVRPDLIERIVRGLSRDGRDDEDGVGSLAVRKRDREHLAIRLQRTWDKVARTAELRRRGAQVLLSFLEGCAPSNSRGKDIQVETTLGELMGSLAGDLEIAQVVTHLSKLLDRCLLWLHEQGVLTLGKGLTIFRPAITVHLEPGSRRFTNADFEPLQVHYDEQTLQIHIMSTYAQNGLSSMRDALRLADDYFKLDRQAFLDRWMKRRGAELVRQTTPESWRAIVEALENSTQARIVSDDREQTNILVLAGPGSGKTRVLVHRIAYLVRVRREDPRGILVLVYNRHAATEIKRRLFDLLGDDARAITVSTCHGFAMRLVGASFAKSSERIDPGAFDKVIRDAVALLRGDDLPREEAEAQRNTLIEGYRWILVDEYQDIGREEYALISAVAGRTIDDEDGRLSLFAVGDDDQNIYAFAGASVAFIRKFEEDYKARPAHLVENYRSSAQIIRAANHIIAPSAERMKAGHDIVVNRSRRRDPEGGGLERLDSVGRGRVQVLTTERNHFAQSVAAVRELERLSKIIATWDWAKAAVIAREWRFLQPVRSYCEARGIPVQMANEDPPSFWRLRETQALVGWLRERSEPIVSSAEIDAWLKEQAEGPWWKVLREAGADFHSELGDRATYAKDFLEWLAEWGREIRKRQTGLLLLTAHRAKGLEFDDVIVLDGAWDKTSQNEDADASRRLYYVAMTRARRSLALMRMAEPHPVLNQLGDGAFMARLGASDPGALGQCGKFYQRLNLSDVDLSFAGRLMGANPSLKAIRAIDVGDPVRIEKTSEHWMITNSSGVTVGRLSRNYQPPNDMTFIDGSVFGVIQRRREDADEQYRQHLQRDTWEVVVPELRFAARN